MKKKFAFAAIIVVVLCLIACDSFFSSSWGSPRDFKASNVKVNAGNVDQWVKKAISEPGLAKAVSEAIRREIGKTYGKDRAKLATGGAKIAVESSKIGEALFTTTKDLMDRLLNDEDFDEDKLNEMLDKFKGSVDKSAADDLAAIVGSCINMNGNVPTFNSDFTSEVKAGDAFLSAMVLTLALMEGHSWDELLDDESLLEGFYSNGTTIEVTGSPRDPRAVALAAYINMFATHPDFKDDDLGKWFADLI